MSRPERRFPTATETRALLSLTNWWYHTMDLGNGISTPGQYGSNLLPVAALLSGVDINNRKCLDVGTMDGKMAFLMEHLGGDVLAVDAIFRPTVPGLIDAFGSSIRYQAGIRDTELADIQENEGDFDFILCAGVLYHVFSPLETIMRVRKTLKNGGLAIFESACTSSRRKLTLHFNRGDFYDEMTTIWLPSVAAMNWMIRYSGFELIGEATISGIRRVPRHAVLARAVSPAGLARSEESDWLRTLFAGKAPGLSHEYLLPQFDIEALTNRLSVAMSANIPSRRQMSARGEHHVESDLLARGTPYAVS